MVLYFLFLTYTESIGYGWFNLLLIYSDAFWGNVWGESDLGDHPYSVSNQKDQMIRIEAKVSKVRFGKINLWRSSDMCLTTQLNFSDREKEQRWAAFFFAQVQAIIQGSPSHFSLTTSILTSPWLTEGEAENSFLGEGAHESQYFCCPYA